MGILEQLSKNTAFNTSFQCGFSFCEISRLTVTKSQSVFSSVSTHGWDGIIHGLCLSSLNAAAGMWSKDHHLLLQGQHVYGDGMECDHDWLLGPWG